MATIDLATRESELIDQILILSESVWENRVAKADIDRWLDNYSGECAAQPVERLNALHLLSQFCFFGQRELRVLLKSLYRDLYQYPIVQAIRESLGQQAPLAEIQSAFSSRLRATRFLAMGNPSESGSHLLYYFRQENKLHRSLFVYQHQLFTGAASDPSTTFAATDLEQVIFLDDLLGSGQQAQQYSSSILRDIREVASRTGKTVKISYYVLFAKKSGLENARAIVGGFDEIHAVHELDASQNAFDEHSRVYRGAKAPVSREAGHSLALHYGSKLFPSFPLGYSDGQMLLGLHHNVPDNTLPIFWNNERVTNWATTFVRYPKEVSWE